MGGNNYSSETYEPSRATHYNYWQYKEGQTDGKGHKIGEIISQSESAVIYLDDTGFLRWQCNIEVCGPESIEYGSKAGVLCNRISTCLPKRLHKKAFRILAHELFAYFSGTNNNKDEFEETNDFILTKVGENYHFHYLLSTAVTTIIFIIIFIFIRGYLKDDLLLFLIGAVSGSIGALASVLQRAYRLEVQKYSSPKLVWLRGISRVCVGIIFGMLVVALQQADLALSFAKANIYGVIVFSFLGGISERFVPELLKTLENQNIKKQDNKQRA